MTSQQKAIQAQIKALTKKAMEGKQRNKYSLYGKINSLKRQFYKLECKGNWNNYLSQ